MKKSILLSAILALSAAAACFTACTRAEVDTNQFSSEGVALSAIAPNPVMRGGVLRIIGSNLQDVAEVRLAGGVSVTDIEVLTSGPRGEARIKVPLEGPAVGPVTIVDKKGNEFSTLTDLTFTEPIEIFSFSPAMVLSGDRLTIKGEYMNIVREVIFANGVYVTEFAGQSRSELTVVVPSNAISGYVIVGDVNELEDKTTIPNQVYTPAELIVGDPTVVAVETAEFKAGETITITGEHLDMIETINMPGAPGIEFSVAEDGRSLSFVLPSTATDGAVTLLSYAGKEFSGGEITTTGVSSLSISPVDSDVYKAGGKVKVSGKDLDLVTAVAFTNASAASFYFSGGDIYATIPPAAKDGVVTLTVGSGKTAATPEITVEKPAISDAGLGDTLDKNVEPGDEVVIKGTNLDLVTSAVFVDGTSKDAVAAEVLPADETTVRIVVPANASTGTIVVKSDAGYTAETPGLTVTYSGLPLSIIFDEPLVSMGKSFSMTGANLNLIEAISINGCKVLDYSLRENGAFAFMLPEKLGPGIYRLDITLVDGSALTWPVPFEVTAPYTETFIWQGSEQTGDYANNLQLGGEDDWVNAGVVEGATVRIYFSAADWSEWSLQTFNGHWGAFPVSPDGTNQFNQDNSPDAQTLGYVAFNVTPEVLAVLTDKQWWGNAIILQGKNLTVTGVSLVIYGAAETTLWEGSEESGDYAGNITLLDEDAWVNAGLAEGATVRIYFSTGDSENWQIQTFDGHWGDLNVAPDGSKQFNADNSPDAAADGYVSFKAEGAVYGALTSH